ncbi:MAG: phage tail tape measure protein [Bacteroidales bacterium]
MADNTVNFTLNLNGNAYNGILQLDDAVKKVVESVGDASSGFKKMATYALRFDVITNMLDKVSQGINSTIQPGIALNASLQDLSAITGVTGNGLKEIEGYARQTAKTFGVDAAQAVDSYKLVLSQLSPEIAKAPAALQAMGKHIATLSKTMGGDTAAATEVLTTAMNQFQISTTDPIKAADTMAEMMNVMAAAAKEGAAELPQIKQALEQAGMAAKGAGVSFEEANAAIQVLDKAGKKGAEGGVALRNVMNILSRGRFLPKDVQDELQAAGVDINSLTDKSKKLSDRLRPLQTVLGDSALLSKLFGMENTNAAMALISGIDEVDRYTEAITGSNTAVEQAATVMESYAERQARVKARFDDLKISIFNLIGDFGIWTEVIAGALIPLAQLSPIFIAVGKLIKLCTIHWSGFVAAIRSGIAKVVARLVALKISVAAAGGLFGWLKITAIAACRSISVAIGSIPIVGWIAVAITALGSLVAYLYTKFEGIKGWLDGVGSAIVMLTGPLGIIINIVTSFAKHWESIKTAFTDGGILAGIKRIGYVLIDAFLKPIQAFLELLAKIPGMGKIVAKPTQYVAKLRESLDKATTVDKKGVDTTAATSVLGNGKKDKETQMLGNGKKDLSGGSLGGVAGSGAGKVQTINITLKSMVETINFNGGLRENTREVEAVLSEQMARILGMASTSA